MLLNNKKMERAISPSIFFVRKICYYGNINAPTSAKIA